MKRRRGFILMDVAIALAIVMILALLLAGAQGRQARAMRRLADRRAVCRFAETILTDLQTQNPLPPHSGPMQFQITPLQAPPAPGQSRWCSVQVMLRQERVSIVGLAPAKAVPQ